MTCAANKNGMTNPPLLISDVELGSAVRIAALSDASIGEKTIKDNKAKPSMKVALSPIFCTIADAVRAPTIWEKYRTAKRM